MTSFSFKEAIKARQQFTEVVKDALVVTHSAGLVLLDGTAPQEIIAVAPPFPARAFRVLFRTMHKSYSLLTSIKGDAIRKKAVYTYQRQTAREVALGAWQVITLLPTIGRFDAVRNQLTHKGVKITIGYMSNEKLPYVPTSAVLQRAAERGVTIIKIPGEHDELIIDPTTVLGYFKQLDNNPRDSRD